VVYDDFLTFAREVILPLRMIAHPDDLRVDGGATEGNRQVVGQFRHNGAVWKVNADTHFEPLLIAITAAEGGRRCQTAGL
jgi:hypothetical protein